MAHLFWHDLFFIQSYRAGTYGHFWSLSVEEHFYVLLPVALYLMLRRNGRSESDPFRFLPWISLGVAVVLLMARLLTARYIPFTWQTHLMPTHLRVDSLLFGVTLSYFAHFHGARFWASVTRWRKPILIVSAMLIAPSLMISQYDAWMYT